MDAAALFNERRGDVAAFTALLFRRSAVQRPPPRGKSSYKEGRSSQYETKTARKQKLLRENTPVAPSPVPALLTSSSSCAAPAYRRPASANVPVSRVLQEAKARAARRRRMGEESVKKKRRTPTVGDESDADAAATFRSATAGAFGFTAQELRDHTYLWMSDAGHNNESAQDVSRQAWKLSGELTPKQQAKLRRLRIKRKHQRLLSSSQWVLWLRRRRRLWQRRRPVARRRHLRRRLALQHGRALPPCSCCAQRKECRRRVKASSTKLVPHVTQWLPSHARLVSRYHHRVVSLVVPLDVTHATGTDVAVVNATGCAGGTAKTSLPSKKRKPVLTARLSVPMEPTRKGHRFLQRWATQLGARQRRQSSHAHGAHLPEQSQAASHTPSALEKTLVADVSHQCVYAVTKRIAARDATPSSLLTPSIVIDALGLRAVPCDPANAAASTAGMVVSIAPIVLHRRLRETTAVAVHGHMWSATEENRALASTRSGTQRGRRRVSTVARHTRVVPVVLVSYADAGGNNSSDNYLLFSEAPVLIPRRASEKLSVRLISAWNPCCRCPAFASVYELWRWYPSTSSELSSLASHTSAGLPLPTCQAAQLVRAVSRRCARLHRRLNHRAAATRQQRIVKHVKKTTTEKAAARFSLRQQKQQQQTNNTTPRKSLPFVASQSRARRTSAHTPSRFSIVLFPSLPPPFLLSAPGPQKDGTCKKECAPYVWRVGFIYHRDERSLRSPVASPKDLTIKSTRTAEAVSSAVRIKTPKDAAKRRVHPAPPRRLYRASVRARRTHFHLARRFFGFLLTTSFESAPTGSSSRRAKARVLGLSERATLMRLVGRPAYPLDYGQSRPSTASQQRSGKQPHASVKCLVTRPGVKRVRSTSSLAAEGEEGARELSTVAEHRSPLHLPITPLPSYVHVLEYYGNLTNAGCRVTVRAAHADKRLPTLHSTVGCVLLRCRATASNAATAVEPVGVVSSSPFFTQRFGCMAAAVWCCSPPASPRVLSCEARKVHPLHGTRDGEADGGSSMAAGKRATSLTESRDDGWTAASLLTAQQVSTNTWFVLAPPEAAATLLRLSATLQRECPPRQRTASRRQRAFDLTRGRAARKLEAFLCDSTFCSPVQLIRWYA
ncbi:hypothetical protein ABB37_07592 [Leptomonas pyrrhocoris]|uniref:Uncharacterized protein n=1 Tax=Leptomonas pyrrhocoris TaxID=157538 RepID=A0A0M9FV78_LEPPY|nr:hypothetical protein ABB37_07592 [Leptomonas pyrrhocoris]KPA76770.1 hypothetical protein ABB37_07592 [Leptomonas pyrrhocoris]|eukprot:XP_015655209.1 hypothetical protein ABB37_07592 [Leptomonas pyrrhocoris]